MNNEKNIMEELKWERKSGGMIYLPNGTAVPYLEFDLGANMHMGHPPVFLPPKRNKYTTDSGEQPTIGGIPTDIVRMLQILDIDSKELPADIVDELAKTKEPKINNLCFYRNLFMRTDSDSAFKDKLESMQEGLYTEPFSWSGATEHKYTIGYGAKNFIKWLVQRNFGLTRCLF